LGASGISRNNKTSKLSALDTRKGSNREFVEAVLIFARPAIATLDNICIETQEWSTVTVSYPATERVKRGGKLLCLQQNQSLGRPQHRCFHVFLTKWCEEPVTIGSRGPQ
jgi:hypothetical protein